MAENCDLICRTCLSFIDCDNAVSINQYTERLNSHIQIKEVIEQCVSELDLDVSSDAVICQTCYDALICTYTFKLKCIQTEERIYSYMEENNLRLGDKIELSKIVKTIDSEMDDVVIISDSESIQENLNESENVRETPILADNVSNTVGLAKKERQNNKESSSTTSAVCLTEQYTCAKCLYKTYRKDLLEKHVHFNCRRKDPIYRCHICLYESVRKNHVSRHIIRHGNHRRYLCGLCSRFFTQKSNLRLHILYMHSGEIAFGNLPYKCGIGDCGDSFQKKFDFNNHIVKHVSYRPFVCQLCNKGFFSETQWDTHFELVHGLSVNLIVE